MRDIAVPVSMGVMIVGLRLLISFRTSAMERASKSVEFEDPIQIELRQGPLQYVGALMCMVMGAVILVLALSQNASPAYAVFILGFEIVGIWWLLRLPG